VVVTDNSGEYLPRYAGDALQMLTVRTSGERAGFVISELTAGMRCWTWAVDRDRSQQDWRPR